METHFTHPMVIDADSALATILATRDIHTGNHPVVYFKELACNVFPPGPSPTGYRNSTRRLRRFIATDPELLARMRNAGYRTTLPYLTCRQMQILSQYI